MASKLIADRSRSGPADRFLMDPAFLAKLAEKWGMPANDVTRVLLEGLDPREERIRLRRQRRDRRIGDVIDDDHLRKEKDI